jgi:hypothetical protein
MAKSQARGMSEFEEKMLALRQRELELLEEHSHNEAMARIRTGQRENEQLRRERNIRASIRGSNYVPAGMSTPFD